MLRAPHLSILHFDTLGEKQMKKLNKTQDVIPSSRHSQQPYLISLHANSLNKADTVDD